MINILVLEYDVKLNKVVGTFLTVKGCLNARDAYDTMYNAQFDLNHDAGY